MSNGVFTTIPYDHTVFLVIVHGYHGPSYPGRCRLTCVFSSAIKVVPRLLPTTGTWYREGYCFLSFKLDSEIWFILGHCELLKGGDCYFYTPSQGRAKKVKFELA
jgi:hypothetical protein